MKVLLSYILKGALLLMAMQFGSLMAENILELRRLDVLQRRTEQEVAALEKRNEALLAEAKALDDDAFYVEYTIRKKLKWVLPGEQQLDLPPRRSPQVTTRLARNSSRNNGATRAPEGASTHSDATGRPHAGVSLARAGRVSSD